MIICLLLVLAAVWLAYGPIAAAKEYAIEQAAGIVRVRIACERENERQLELEKERQLEREPKAAASHTPQANNAAAPVEIRAPSRIVDVTVPVNMQTTDVLV